MEYYGNILCISMRDLVDGGIMSEANYKQLAWRGRIKIMKRGGGAGNRSLVAIDSLPQRFVKKIRSGNLPSPFVKWMESQYSINQNAITFYIDPAICGVRLKTEKAWQYATNASILDCLLKIVANQALVYKLFGGRISWEIICEYLKTNKSRYNHTLPISKIRLQEKIEQYRRIGFKTLISKRIGNQNAKKG